MRLLFAQNFLWYLFLTLVVCGGITYGGFLLLTGKEATQESTTVSLGTVSYTATISGKIEAKNTARVGFPTIGTVQNVYKFEGEKVQKGEILASLTQDSAVAEYNAALQNLSYQKHAKEELLRGPESESRAVTKTNVEIAEENLTRVKAEQAQLVKNARTTLLSTDIAALPVNKINDDVPPIVTGSYLCDTEGIYTLSVFASRSFTGRSYKLSGLEEGTFSAFTETSAPLGTCGLQIQFDADENYRSDDWTIAIPNTQSSQYIQNRNTYTLALQQESNAIRAAEQALELARNTERDANAPASTEAINKIDAQIAEAEAFLKAKEAQIANYTIKAPFDAIITDSEIKVGETANLSSAMTLIETGFFELKARIPEVDIAKIKIGNIARVKFDAAPDDIITAHIDYISPLAQEVDGVAYYEARLILDREPTWLRAGLNADIDIVIAEKENTLRLPKHFITTDQSGTSVLVLRGGQPVSTKVETGLVGSNGFIEVTNLPEGTEISLP